MLPGSSHLLLSATMAALKKSIPAHSIVWNAVNNLHVTLQFLNGLQQKHTSALIDHVRSQLKNMPAFQLKLGDLEMFPTLEHPRIISLTVEPQAVLMELSNTIGQAISALGYPVESRLFQGHITFGRLHHYKPKAALLSQIHLPDIPAITIDKVYLVESKPDQKGSNYHILAQFDLICFNNRANAADADISPV